MKKFLLKFSDSLLSKEEIRSVKGGYGGGSGSGGTSYVLWCAKPSGGPSYGPINGTGACPSYSAANQMCNYAAGAGYIESNLYCS